MGFFGGLAFPTGDFGSTSSVGAGGASTGFAFGGEVGIPLPSGISITGSATVAFNALEEEYVSVSSGSSAPIIGDLGRWTTIWPMAGLRYTGSFTPIAGYFLQGQVGLLMGLTPEVNASQSGYRYTAKSASGECFSIRVWCWRNVCQNRDGELAAFWQTAELRVSDHGNHHPIRFYIDVDVQRDEGPPGSTLSAFGEN